jgi:hypothetical protein
MMNNKRIRVFDPTSPSPSVKRVKSNDDDNEQHTQQQQLPSVIIPEEILIEILTFIPYTEILKDFTLVSHYFHNIILGDFGPKLWQQICNDQCIYYDTTTFAAESFVTKYKPPSIEFYYNSHNYIYNDIYKQDLIETLKIIEPFVRELIIPNNGNCIGLIDDLRAHLNREIFPQLTKFNAKVSPLKLQHWCGPDLKRFKHVNLEILQHEFNGRFGSLERLSMHGCRVYEWEILKQNQTTLSWLQFFKVKKYDARCFECIAPTISYLTLDFSHREGEWKQIQFSNLRYLDLGAYRQQIMGFFSVSHPLLTEVKIHENPRYFGHDPVIDLVLQPSIRSIQYYGSAETFNKIAMAVHPEVLERLTLETYSATNQLVDITRFSKLELLVLKSQELVADIAHIVKSNNLSVLRLPRPFDLVSTGANLSNLIDLELFSLNAESLSMVMKIPKLHTLQVEKMDLSYPVFTRLAHQPCSIAVYVIEEFQYCPLMTEAIHIIAPIENLSFGKKLHNLNSTSIGNLENLSHWILFMISTLNVNKISSYLTDSIIELFFGKPIRKYDQNMFFSPALHIIDTIRSTLDRVLTDGHSLQVNDMEKEMIKKKFDEMLDIESMIDDDKVHPAISCLLKDARSYLLEKRRDEYEDFY